jgi:RHS repeat-associated protein
LIGRTGATSNSYLYRSQQFDSDLGFYYNRARYYDQSKGRFLSRDSFSGINTEPRSLHKYLYGNGNPVGNSNPSGFLSLASQAVLTNYEQMAAAAVELILDVDACLIDITGSIIESGWFSEIDFLLCIAETMANFAANTGGKGGGGDGSGGGDGGILGGGGGHCFVAVQGAAKSGGGGCGGGGGRSSLYEVGTYKDLKNGDIVGDGLENHHVPQKAIAKTKIRGYDEDEAPAIRLRSEEHSLVSSLQRDRVRENDLSGWSASDLVNDDLEMLRDIGVPDKHLRELEDLIWEKYRLP